MNSIFFASIVILFSALPAISSAQCPELTGRYTETDIAGYNGLHATSLIVTQSVDSAGSVVYEFGKQQLIADGKTRSSGIYKSTVTCVAGDLIVKHENDGSDPDNELTLEISLRSPFLTIRPLKANHSIITGIFVKQ